MDLADKIARANENGRPVDDSVDELGLGIRDDSPNYFAARALKINTDAIRDGKTTALLHHRGDTLWLGNEAIQRGGSEIVRLCKPARKLHDWEVERIYDALVKYTPEFDPTKLMITDRLYWDIEEGCIKESDTPFQAVL